MSRKKLLKKIQSDSRFLPFNNKYDFEYVLKYLDEIKSDEYEALKLTTLCTVFLNPYFIELKNYISEINDRNKLSKILLTELLITIANRNTYLISLKSKASMGSKNEFNYDEITNSMLQSNIPDLGLINAQAALEASHDGVNIILNLLHQFSDNYGDSEIEMDHVHNSAKAFGFANLYTVIKSGYELAVWEDYVLTYNPDDKILRIKCPNPKNQYLNKIGEYRLRRNLFAAKSVIGSAYENKNQYFEFLTIEAKRRRKAKRLKSVSIIENEIEYKLGDGFEKKSILKELFSFSDLTAYYNFIENEDLPNFENIKLYDVLVIFSEVQSLFEEVLEISKEETSNDVSNFNQYRAHIYKNSLIDFVFSKTKYSKSQISEVLNLFIHKDGFHNIWENPIIEHSKKLFPIFLPLISPNILRMVDYWLERGGFNLDSRGEMFEKHIKEILELELKKKGFFVNILNENIFRNKNDQFEEIDLVVELKNITIIAEVKCIKYPFDARDYHNMHKRLKEGVSQIKRKKDFIEKTSKDLNLDCFQKKLVPTVITNYPMFSGYIIDDIPITDFSLLENYFINGALNKAQMKFEKNQIGIDENKYLPLKYYENEDELSDNFEPFLIDPIPVKEKLKDITIKESQISLPEADPKILMDYVHFKQSSVI